MARPLAYLTDVEGRWDKVVDFVADNPYVSLDAAGRIIVAERATFVFGGDAVDRGPAGRRVVEALVEAKRRQPESVVLLAGNRDINKLRLMSELNGQPPARAPVGLDRPALLRWIFANTMGAGQAFDWRQRELSARVGHPVDDEAVVESYVEDVAENGATLAYVALAQLAFRQDETLIVHGAVTAQSLGTVPGRAAPIDDAEQWIAALNGWYAQQVDAYRSAPRSAAAWQALCAYQSPVPGTRGNQASVVYGRMLDDALRPQLPSTATRDRLRAAGITRLFVGHTPTGDAPATVRAPDGAPPFELVMADNSYARLERGSRVICDADGHVTLGSRVRLDDGTESTVRADLRRNGPVSPLGRFDAATGEIVKGQLADDRWHLFRQVSERQVEQVAVSADELVARTLVAEL